ncbi:hypothetical protein PACTADRAFT_430 [Pachysolen tannophilus NRRL Y-2460]|uniref:Zn(2)-C6 fungal-type domain-containing protein n=1 Tax=Pachysolen tannophilus NRRL Y-2460 TaxID=669874 RepID=A0A1E4U1R0_PACTA|nr:hypothetical protein PACTADRAFT_430 [Pachysolen tannophilus NRRL Y-2460]
MYCRQKATESETSNQTRKKKEVFKTKDDIGTEEKSNRILKESNVNSTRQENSISKNQEPSKKNFKKLRDFNNKSKISLSSPLKQEIKSRKTLTRKFKQDNSQVKKKKRKLSTKATIKENEVNFTTSASASTTNKESPKNLISQRPKRKISKPKYYFNESFSETSRPSSKNTKTIKPSSEASQTETFDPEIDEGDHKEVDDHSAKKTKSVKRSKKMETTYTKLSTARSRNGCWTCRLRRKKCPEEKPLCSECSRLGLKCDGYNDERPIYMNNKKAAKKRMEEIKEVTNLKKKLRMSSRSKKTV